MNAKRINITQGEHGVSRDPAAVMTTVLGSCVAACLHDPVARVGGMNHFLLPESRNGGSASAIYGLQSMELLINALMGAGADRRRLRAHLYGGAGVVDNIAANIGQANAAFARDFLATEGIPLVHEDLGGRLARRVEFMAAVGKARHWTVGAPPKPAPLPTAACIEPADAGIEIF